MEEPDWSWLECEVGPGLWDVERAVTFREAEECGGKSITIDVWRGLVREERPFVRGGDPVPGRVRVLELNRDGELSTVMLPVQSALRGMNVGVPASRLTRD